MEHLPISKIAARRFVLGRQGLWPGRRWAGKEGTAAALRAVEAVQLDPLNVVARSHDIVLWGRVLDYRPEVLDQVVYQERQFFDYGGGLFLYPMAELPFWRIHMRRQEQGGRMANFAADHPELLEEVRAEIRKRGPLGNRDFKGYTRISNSYRGRKDTGLILYYLWLTGELMIHHRQGFERLYDFRDRVAPPHLADAAGDEEAENFFARKAVAFMGITRPRAWKNSFSGFIHRQVSQAEADQRLEALIRQGVVAPVRIEGSKESWLVLHSDLELLSILEAGKIPEVWCPCATTTEDEAVFLAPLDIVSARGRAAWLFDFEYIWEVYKPSATRRWGYYTLPILVGDRLVARLDPKLDRKTATLQINGFWLEDHAPVGDPAFAQALARGFIRFANFLNTRRLNLAAIQPAGLRASLQEKLDSELDVQVNPLG